MQTKKEHPEGAQLVNLSFMDLKRESIQKAGVESCVLYIMHRVRGCQGVFRTHLINRFVAKLRMLSRAEAARGAAYPQGTQAERCKGAGQQPRLQQKGFMR